MAKNLIKAYESDRKKRVKEFQSKIHSVIREILRLSEMIPHEELEKVLRMGIIEVCAYDVFDEFSLFDEYDEESYRQNRGKFFEFCYECSGKYIPLGRFAYNTVAEDELEKFVKMNYPGIDSFRCHSIYLEKRTIEFSFDAEIQNAEGKITKMELLSSAKKFNADIAELGCNSAFRTQVALDCLGVLHAEFDASRLF